MAEAVEGLASENPWTIRQTILRLLALLGGSGNGPASQDVEVEDEGSDFDYEAFDDYDVTGTTSADEPKLNMQRLQK